MESLIKILNDEAVIAKKRNIRDLFLSETERLKNFSVDFDNFKLDFSKQNISQETWGYLLEYLSEINIQKKIYDLFSGKNVNITENRSALHFILRAPKSQKPPKDYPSSVLDVHEQLHAMSSIVNKVRSARWRGYTGKVIKDVVSLGVGGSELGPLLACDALHEIKPGCAKNVQVHFVSSMDGTQISQLLERLEQETTLFIISSKSFTTVDTFYNVNTVLKWMTFGGKDENLVKKHHFLGISANKNKMDEWGVSKENQLMLWNWVGGRFSLWSAIGLPIAIKYGMDIFHEMLDGAHAMDLHFSNALPESNLPIVLALISFWNSSFMEITANAVLPYDGRLKLLPNYLSQLEMESNGKCVSISGEKVKFKTSPIIWGDLGPNAQHAFYQLLHQGTQDVFCDFITTVKRYDSDLDSKLENQALLLQQNLSLANCFAQSSVLAFGNSFIETHNVNPHKSYKGNQPSSTLLLKQLTPQVLGGLIALYEHKTYVLSCLWDINPFDQWGVELGKVLSESTLEAIKNQEQRDRFDDSTRWLLSQVDIWSSSDEK
ncbi:MAG: glucose-6-phosphate isomerase [Kangiellaceae bacterium]|nr:glucose-6-phosphate isomerase [Kangiellaceae bacterium]